MSDGPHRSLPMRRHWKDFAERAAKAAFSPDQVCEALPLALKRDILEAPIEAMREILDNRKPDLFSTHHIEKLEELRSSCRGSAVANLAIDCAVEAVQRGLKGAAALKSALQNTVEETARRAIRGIEEHYQREARPRSADYVRVRLDTAHGQVDTGTLVTEILGPAKLPSPHSLHLPRQTGVDEGPKP
jgi:hypothetical protein